MIMRGLALVMIIASLFLSGCETLVGATKGLAYGVSAAGEGMSKDTAHLWSACMKTDKWIKENLW